MSTDIEKTGPLTQTITQKIRTSLEPSHLDVINESDRHNVPANSETHFKLVIVSESFEELSLINRHRKVNQLLADELAGGVHALSLHTMTETEWQAKQKAGGVAESPDCLGGDGRAGT